MTNRENTTFGIVVRTIILIIMIVLLFGCTKEYGKPKGELGAGEIQEITLDDGTRCVIYTIPIDRIRGISCEFK